MRQFRGIFQILHTPFDAAGRIDWSSFERQIDYCLQAGVHGLVTPAMASEFFSLSDQERCDITEFTLRQVARRVPVVIAVQGVSLPVAEHFACHALEHGADGLMAMPPYLRKAAASDLEVYYRQLASLGLPLIIQNNPAPIGTPLGPAELARLMDRHPGISYIKEETPPILQRVTQILTAAPDCHGVFGGANGLYLIDELERGACGNMPAGGLIDVQVKIFNLYEHGHAEKARSLQHQLLPLLTYAAMYGVTFHKFLLWRRGVLADPYARDPQQLRLDDGDCNAIERYWAYIQQETLAAYPFKQ